MRPRLPLALLLTSLVLLAGVAFACGGDGDDDAAEPTATEEERDTTPAEADDGEPTDEPEPTQASSGEPPFDSYHYTVDLAFTVEDAGDTEGTSISGSVEGDFVAPDSHSFTSSFEFAGIGVTQEAVIIGDDAWYREGSGDWTATTVSDPQVQDALSLSSADPGFLQDQEFASDISALDSEAETLNGVETRRYHIPKEAIETLAELLGEDFLEDAAGLEDFEMTVWLEDETGGLVRAEFTATASPDVFGAGAPFDLSAGATVSITMTINVTQINDESIEIEPPT